MAPKLVRRGCGPARVSARFRSAKLGMLGRRQAADTAGMGDTNPTSATLKTTKDHKRGTVRGGPRPGRAGGAGTANFTRLSDKERRRCPRPRRRAPAVATRGGGRHMSARAGPEGRRRAASDRSRRRRTACRALAPADGPRRRVLVEPRLPVRGARRAGGPSAGAASAAPTSRDRGTKDH